MQTFLPDKDFFKSAQTLDNRRLYKQIVECKQIYLALTEGNSKWINHPAVKMWKGYENVLLDYMMYCFQEWQMRRYPMLRANSFIFYTEHPKNLPRELPPWLGNEVFHKSHRLNLLWKDPEHYSQYFKEPIPTEKPPYVWPEV